MNRLPSISEAARLIRQGQLAARELVEHCLARIERLEPCIQAWVSVHADDARREAERLDRLARRGQWLGPLHGIPIGIKDIVDVAGWPTRAGSRLLEGRAAEADAPVVAQLRENGAIVLGKTATTEFAYLDPAPTRNPWNPEHTPGGSSSGSAAAVAAEMCMAAIGSQTGGSIIRPAAFCGVAGLKPTFDAVDRRGVVPVSRHLDHIGPIARSASDLAILLAAMTGRVESLLELQPPEEAPLLYVIDEFFMEEADEDIRRATRAAYERFVAAGAALRPMRLPASFAEARRLHKLIMAVEAAAVHRTRFAEHAGAYGPHIASLIRQGLDASAVDYADAIAHLESFRAEMAAVFAGGRIAVTPATVTAAPAGLESTGDPRFNAPWSYAGLPAVTIPCAVTAGGLPCGLQLVGPAGQEPHLLATAAWCERAVGFPPFRLADRT